MNAEYKQPALGAGISLADALDAAVRSGLPVVAVSRDPDFWRYDDNRLLDLGCVEGVWEDRQLICDLGICFASDFEDRQGKLDVCKAYDSSLLPKNPTEDEIEAAWRSLPWWDVICVGVGCRRKEKHTGERNDG